MCASGQCIPDSQYCDMKRDCFDSSDEQQCGIVFANNESYHKPLKN